MRTTSYELQGPMLIHGERYHDERGFFSESFNQKKYSELGLPDFVQDNLSKSEKNVFRGMHWQTSPEAQGKLVTCLRGAILDFVTDIRLTSLTFGQSIEVNLDSDSLTSFWVPEGFAHGFLSLQDETLVSYKVTRFWSKENERSMTPLHFSKKLPPDLVMSEKDQLAPKFCDLNSDDLF